MGKETINLRDDDANDILDAAMPGWEGYSVEAEDERARRMANRDALVREYYANQRGYKFDEGYLFSD